MMGFHDYNNGLPLPYVNEPCEVPLQRQDRSMLLRLPEGTRMTRYSDGRVMIMRPGEVGYYLTWRHDDLGNPVGVVTYFDGVTVVVA